MEYNYVKGKFEVHMSFNIQEFNLLENKNYKIIIRKVQDYNFHYTLYQHKICISLKSISQSLYICFSRRNILRKTTKAYP